MADDITLPGTAAIVATDDIGSSRHVQLVKQVFGTDGTATMVSSTNPLPVFQQPLVATGSASSAANIIGSQDCAPYSSINVQMTGTYSATVRAQGSPDGSTWTSVNVFPVVAGLTYFGSPTDALVSGNAYHFPVTFRYYRIAVTAYTSGTAAAVMTAVTAPPATVASYVINSSLAVAPQSFNGVSYDPHRLATTFKSVTATGSGNTAVWTPTSGKRFQLLRVQFFASGDAARTSGGVVTVKLQDATTDVGISVPVYVPTSGGTGLGGWTSGPIDIGPYGYRSSAVNQVLNVNLSAALTAGSIGVVAAGVEE